MNIMLTIWENELVKSLLATVAIAIGAGLSTLIGMFFKRLADSIAEKTKSEKYSRTIQAVSRIIQSAILMVQQTFVYNLKKEGKFDSEAQAKALDLAIKSAASQINDEMKLALTELFGDVEEWLRTQVEAFIANEK